LTAAAPKQVCDGKILVNKRGQKNAVFIFASGLPDFTKTGKMYQNEHKMVIKISYGCKIFQMAIKCQHFPFSGPKNLPKLGSGKKIA
jgi:hypothetical protein